MKQALWVALTGTVLLQSWAFADQVVRREDLPPQPEFLPSGTVDVWSFYCPAGGSVEIKVDTVSMALTGTSPLNPAVLVFQGANNLGVGTAGLVCTATSDCAATCVDFTAPCALAGEHNVLIFNMSDSNNCGKATGTYQLSVQVFEGPNETGNTLTAEQTALGGEPVKRLLSGNAGFVSGPAEDDVYWDGLGPPAATATGGDLGKRGTTTNYYKLVQ